MNKIDINNCTILITGVAGFIGGALALRLITSTKARIIGIDNLNDYYDVRLKEYRLDVIREIDVNHRFVFKKLDIVDRDAVYDLFNSYKPDIVVHLAAQAGVRYSIENPYVYIQNNIVGFFNIIDACRKMIEMNAPVRHFLFASSSSVYGNNEKIPYLESDNTDHPVSLYAATKKADEVIGYSYAQLYGIPMTGMRFFTVYGPVGRPDMAYYKFTEELVKGKNVKLYNQGKNKRDFTYIDDVVDAIEKIMQKTPVVDRNGATYDIYNIGSNHPLETVEFVKILSEALKEHRVLDEDFVVDDSIVLCDAVVGDVDVTYADTERLYECFGIKPKHKIDDGLKRFAEWYFAYRNQ
uniref:Nucleoside-diphosphate-sugar epimerase n=1 Tax=Eubacterium cellulosolvens (strain ATCC 43171 / JCM 9499 / 6) TaxID=633697 RepID=I5AW49_EUBC6